MDGNKIMKKMYEIGCVGAIAGAGISLNATYNMIDQVMNSHKDGDLLHLMK